MLFVPWGIAQLFDTLPVLSYLIAWLGSFYIFYLTLSGRLRQLPQDRPVTEQLMRPVFLPQLIFAGYMCCSSIFYFLSILGYENFHPVSANFVIDEEKVALTAQCQRYYCLGHAAFATGILVFMRYPVPRRYQIEVVQLGNLLLLFALASFVISLFFYNYEPLFQFYVQLNSLSFMAGTLALAFAIPLKKVTNTLVCLVLYLFNFYQAFVSGFKEPVIISALVLAVFLYPSYKKLITIVGIPALLALFVFLPAYVANFREIAWADGAETADLSRIALEASRKNEQVDDTNWSFLVSRSSEIEMFTGFVQSTPSKIDYYGTKLLQQSAIAVIPRIFWPGKTNTEELTMERVYDAGVIERASQASAKPAFIVDAYLSGGATGIVLFLFAYGAIAQLISLRAEELFGGYILGTALMFSGLFQSFWRGLSIEFLVNATFWAYVSMLLFFRIFKALKILVKI